ncbi:predicted protein [Fibroporia radiculosa]|uniref:Uncharacterized protein n=1 Tax=Fibroporia radiculosa TaxID=599839 RepID=J7RVU1_9APHY|nr:predicted protein [Fibroporia radiculosa]
MEMKHDVMGSVVQLQG